MRSKEKSSRERLSILINAANVTNFLFLSLYFTLNRGCQQFTQSRTSPTFNGQYSTNISMPLSSHFVIIFSRKVELQFRLLLPSQAVALPILCPHICIPAMQSLIIPSTNFSLNTTQHHPHWPAQQLLLFSCEVKNTIQLSLTIKTLLSPPLRACAACALPR